MHEPNSLEELDLVQILAAQAVLSEARATAEHPSSHELVAYQENRLPEPAARQVRRHLVACGECARDLLAVGSLDLDESGDDLDAAWEQLRETAREIETIGDRRAWREPGAENSETETIEQRIELLYDEIIAMCQRSPTSGSAQDEIDRLYAELLELQTAEARQFRERFEASLDMPVDAGDQILARSRALREELEDLAAPDRPGRKSDAPKASAQAG